MEKIKDLGALLAIGAYAANITTNFIAVNKVLHALIPNPSLESYTAALGAGAIIQGLRFFWDNMPKELAWTFNSMCAALNLYVLYQPVYKDAVEHGNPPIIAGVVAATIPVVLAFLSGQVGLAVKS